MKISEGPDYILSLVKQNFEFLFVRGFEITDVSYIDNIYFSVILDAECRIKISGDRRDGVDITVAPQSVLADDWWSWYALDVLVYYLSNGEFDVIEFNDASKHKEEQVQTLALILSVYIDDIISLLANPKINEYDSKLKKIRQTIDKLRLGKKS